MLLEKNLIVTHYMQLTICTCSTKQIEKYFSGTKSKIVLKRKFLA